MDKKKRAIALGLASAMLASMTSIVAYAESGESVKSYTIGTIDRKSVV